MKNLLDEAKQIINSHNYPICEQCTKRCKNTCLPLEMFVQLVQQDEATKLEMLENIKYLFEDGE